MSTNIFLKFQKNLMLLLALLVAPMLVLSARSVSAASKSDDCFTRANSKPSISVSGTKATATFTVDKQCVNKKITLASYKAPNGTTGQPYSKQEMYRWTTFSYPKAGKYKLSVSLPSCYYQVDLAGGNSIDEFSKGKTYAQQDRLLASKHGGSKSCEAKPVPVAPSKPAKPVAQTPAPAQTVNQTTIVNQNTNNVSCDSLNVYPTQDDSTYKFSPTTSGSGPKSYKYDYGDGQSMTSSDPMTEHTYSQPGTYNASLTMSGSNGSNQNNIVCKSEVKVVGQKESEPIAPVTPSQPQPPAEQQTAPSPSTQEQSTEQPVASGKMPDTGPGTIAAVGFIWTFMGAATYAYRGRFTSMVASLVTRLG